MAFSEGASTPTTTMTAEPAADVALSDAEGSPSAESPGAAESNDGFCSVELETDEGRLTQLVVANGWSDRDVQLHVRHKCDERGCASSLALAYIEHSPGKCGRLKRIDVRDVASMTVDFVRYIPLKRGNGLKRLFKLLVHEAHTGEPGVVCLWPKENFTYDVDLRIDPDGPLPTCLTESTRDDESNQKAAP